MTGFVLKRLAAMVPLLFVIALVSFLFMRTAPGGPFDDERTLPPQIERSKGHEAQPCAHMNQILYRNTRRAQAGHDPAHAGSSNDVNGNIGFLQRS
jgi:ABC-type microcin C transport system permease subunit YejB